MWCEPPAVWTFGIDDRFWNPGNKSSNTNAPKLIESAIFPLFSSDDNSQLFTFRESHRERFLIIHKIFLVLNRKTDNDKLLEIHKQCHVEGSDQLVCCFCGKEAPKVKAWYGLYIHMVNKHPDIVPAPLQCAVCSKYWYYMSLCICTKGLWVVDRDVKKEGQVMPWILHRCTLLLSLLSIKYCHDAYFE